MPGNSAAVSPIASPLTMIEMIKRVRNFIFSPSRRLWRGAQSPLLFHAGSTPSERRSPGDYAPAGGWVAPRAYAKPRRRTGRRPAMALGGGDGVDLDRTFCGD